MLDGLAASTPDATAVPERASVTDGVEPLLARTIVPVAGPTEVGVKVTLSGVCWPAASVIGKAGELIVQAAPLTVAEDMVTLESLEFTSVLLTTV